MLAQNRGGAAALFLKDGSPSAEKGCGLGLVREHFGEGLDAEVNDQCSAREAVRVYESPLGQAWEEELAAAQPLRRSHVLHHPPCEASGDLARYDGVHYGYGQGWALQCPVKMP